MSMTRRDWADLAKIFKDQVEKIKSEHMDENEEIICIETVYMIVSDTADMISSRYPGFDRARFAKDSGVTR